MYFMTNPICSLVASTTVPRTSPRVCVAIKPLCNRADGRKGLPAAPALNQVYNSVYILIAIVKKRLNREAPLYIIL